MKKIQLGINILLPMPVVLVGALVQGKVNFMAVGWMTRVNEQPPLLAVSIGRQQYTAIGIRENKVFSVCLPSSALVEKTDYCGIVSGRKADKSGLFRVFYGSMQKAPMIEECPLCLECRLVNTVELPNQYLFIGEIAAAYSEEAYLSDGKLDYKKIDPVVLTQPEDAYLHLGEKAGDAFSCGKKFLHP